MNLIGASHTTPHAHTHTTHNTHTKHTHTAHNTHTTRITYTQHTHTHTHTQACTQIFHWKYCHGSRPCEQTYTEIITILT